VIDRVKSAIEYKYSTSAVTWSVVGVGGTDEVIVDGGDGDGDGGLR